MNREREVYERVASVRAYASGRCREGTGWLAVKIPELESATAGGAKRSMALCGLWWTQRGLLSDVCVCAAAHCLDYVFDAMPTIAPPHQARQAIRCAGET